MSKWVPADFVKCLKSPYFLRFKNHRKVNRNNICKDVSMNSVSVGNCSLFGLLHRTGCAHVHKTPALLNAKF